MPTEIAFVVILQVDVLGQKINDSDNDTTNILLKQLVMTFFSCGVLIANLIHECRIPHGEPRQARVVLVRCQVHAAPGEDPAPPLTLHHHLPRQFGVSTCFKIWRRVTLTFSVASKINSRKKITYASRNGAWLHFTSFNLATLLFLPSCASANLKLMFPFSSCFWFLVSYFASFIQHLLISTAIEQSTLLLEASTLPRPCLSSPASASSSSLHSSPPAFACEQPSPHPSSPRA